MQNITEVKRKATRLRCENIQTIFVSGVMSSNSRDKSNSGVMSSNSARVEKLRWPVMIVKLRKGQKYSKIVKTENFFKKSC